MEKWSRGCGSRATWKRWSSREETRGVLTEASQTRQGVVGGEANAGPRWQIRLVRCPAIQPVACSRHGGHLRRRRKRPF